MAPQPPPPPHAAEGHHRRWVLRAPKRQPAAPQGPSSPPHKARRGLRPRAASRGGMAVPRVPQLRGRAAAEGEPCKDPPQSQAAGKAALSGKGAGPELGRRRRGWVLSAPVSLLAARLAAQAAAAGSRVFLSPGRRFPLHHDPLAVALLGLLHLSRAARLGADGQVPGREADGRLQHHGASRF